MSYLFSCTQINCVCHCIRSMFIVLTRVYNFVRAVNSIIDNMLDTKEIDKASMHLRIQAL